MENSQNKPLSFPQRNWLLLCVLVAILSPLLTHWLGVGARRENYKEATEQHQGSGQSGSTENAAGSAGAAAGSTDTSGNAAKPAAGGQ